VTDQIIGPKRAYPLEDGIGFGPAAPDVKVVHLGDEVIGLADVYVKPHMRGGKHVAGFYRKRISLGGGEHFQLNEYPATSINETPRFGNYNMRGLIHRKGPGGSLTTRDAMHGVSATRARPGEFPGNPQYRVEVNNLGQHGIAREGIGHFNVHSSGKVTAVDPKTGKPTKLPKRAHAIGAHLAYSAAHAHKRGAWPGTMGQQSLGGAAEGFAE
jgi:hypothetical protein